MKKTVLLLMMITIVSKLFGFTRDITLSYFYGASNISDAYLVSFSITDILFGIVAIGISTCFIPMYSTIEKDLGVEASNDYTNNLINIILLISTIIITFGLIFMKPMIRIFTPGFNEETLSLTTTFSRIVIFGAYFTMVRGVFRGFLNIKGNYTIPALIGFPLNFFVILSIYLSTKNNIQILAIGAVVAFAFQVIILIPSMLKNGFKYKFILNIKDKYIKNTARLVVPLIIGISVHQINVFVDRRLASEIITGGISALNYSDKLVGFIQGIVVVSISTVMYPIISKMAAKNNMTGLKNTIAEAITGVSVLVIPALIGFMVFSEPIIRALYGRGEFDSVAISITSSALFYYGIGMIGFGIHEIISKTFYSLQDTKTPMLYAAYGVCLNIVLNIILSRFLGIGGLALATSISAIFTIILLFIKLRKRIGPFGMKQVSSSFLKILLTSSIMGIITRILFNYLSTDVLSPNLALLITIVFGALLYFIIIYFMKIKDVDIIVHAIKRRFNKIAAPEEISSINTDNTGGFNNKNKLL